MRTPLRHAVEEEGLHAGSLLEWWFVQGSFEGKGISPRHFMASFFRQSAVSPAGVRQPDGHWLLVSLLDPATQRNMVLSQVDRPSLEMFLEAAPKLQGTNLDPVFLDAYLKETAAYGPPRPVRLSPAPPVLRPGQLRAEWGAFSLSTSPQGIELSFDTPEERKACRFVLRPRLPRMALEGMDEEGAYGMAYVTYPALDLEGSFDGRRVTGRGWFEHQWGDCGWLLSGPPRRRLRSWTWFGIDLDGDRRLVVVLRRNVERGSLVGKYAALIEPGREVRAVRSVTARPVRHWESPRTGIRYPLSWRIVIPELSAELLFEPLADDQEIPVLGIGRAVWEGAGTVQGSVGGRRVAGPARLELWGHGYVFDLAGRVGRSAARVDARIAEFLPRAFDETGVRRLVGPPSFTHEPEALSAVLSRPLWDLLERKGKRWRPAFGLLLLEALGTPSPPYEQLVSVMAELPHTGALIIDDIEDGSRLRRGDECIHLRYGMDVAINAANTAYFLPFLLLQRHPLLSPAQQLELYRILSEQFVRSHFGQGLDIYWSRNVSAANVERWTRDSIGPKVLQAYAFKTGGIVEGLADAAGVVAAADGTTREACRRFARDFAVAFQVANDVLSFAPAADLGKTEGEDLADGKLTYVTIRALEMLGAKGRRRLKAILCSPRLRGDPGVLSEGVDLVRGCGALDSCRREARALFEGAWVGLAEKVPPSEPRIALRALCSRLVGDKRAGQERP